MRIFAALHLPGDALDCILRWREGMMGSHPGLKWVSADMMHLTLRFFGDIDPARLETVRALLGSWRPGPLPFTLDRLGYFGPKGSPSVYWLGGKFPAEVASMAGELRRIPDGKGRMEMGAFVPHLTVARRRRTGAAPELRFEGDIRGVIAEASLVDSRLTSAGPVYRFIERYSL